MPSLSPLIPSFSDFPSTILKFNLKMGGGFHMCPVHSQLFLLINEFSSSTLSASRECQNPQFKAQSSDSHLTHVSRKVQVATCTSDKVVIDQRF